MDLTRLKPRPRALGISFAITAVATIGILCTTCPAPTAGPKTVLAEAKLAAAKSWIMGGSGLPIPPQSYMDALSALCIDPARPSFEGQPQFPVDATNPLYTPEGLYPNSGVNSLELDTSLTAACSNASTCRS
jgi:hypothetical protein